MGTRKRMITLDDTGVTELEEQGASDEMRELLMSMSPAELRGFVDWVAANMDRVVEMCRAAEDTRGRL